MLVCVDCSGIVVGVAVVLIMQKLSAWTIHGDGLRANEFKVFIL